MLSISALLGVWKLFLLNTKKELQAEKERLEDEQSNRSE